jgi:predicted RNA binding protein YcfA (HicA-like mRNA interferase family)
LGHSDLPLASRREHVAAFRRAGFQVLKRRGKGSHVMLKKPGHPYILTLPEGTVKRALLAKQIKQAGLTIEEYLEFFKGSRP